MAFAHHSRVFGKLFTSRIEDDVFDSAPIWGEYEENPPVSARKAIQLADAKQTELVQDNEDYKWQCRFATLVFNRNTGRCYYWWVSYEAVFRGSTTGIPPSLDLYVLMDGKLIEPTVSDKAN